MVVDMVFEMLFERMLVSVGGVRVVGKQKWGVVKMCGRS